MIASFGDKSTEDVYHGINSRETRKLPNAMWPVIRRKLDQLVFATNLRDLAVPRATGWRRCVAIAPGGTASE